MKAQDYYHQVQKLSNNPEDIVAYTLSSCQRYLQEIRGALGANIYQKAYELAQKTEDLLRESHIKLKKTNAFGQRWSVFFDVFSWDVQRVYKTYNISVCKELEDQLKAATDDLFLTNRRS